MRYLVFCLIWHSLSFAENVVHDAEELVFNWFWSGNERELYFNIDLFEGLYFDSLYSVAGNEMGLMCEISCKPYGSDSFKTREGHSLKNVAISVFIENTENAKELLYKIQVQSSYQKLDEEGNRMTLLIDYAYEDFLLNPTIDVTEEALFYSFIEKEDSGVILFKNLFKSFD